MDVKNKRGEPASKWGLIIQFIKFNLVGVLNTAIDMGAFAILTHFGLNMYAANVISYSLGLVNSWVWNSRWTFGDKKMNGKKVLGFVAVNLLAMGVQMAVLWVGKGKLGLNHNLAKLLAIPFGLVVNFLGNRLFVFK